MLPCCASIHGMVLSQSSSSSAYSDNDHVDLQATIDAKADDSREQLQFLRLSRDGNKDHRCIIHLDIDYFYAQVEIVAQKLNQGIDLENEPVGIQQNMTISTCNYISREKYGLHKMMHVNEARKKCPKLVIIQGNMNLYRKVSDSIFTFVSIDYFTAEERELVSIEQCSIDECYIEVTKLVEGNILAAIPVSTKLRKAIFQKFGYTSSSGISFNKLMSKVACSKNKPNGQSLIATVSAARRLIQHCSIKNVIPGVGEQTANKMKDYLNVNTIDDLFKVSLKELSKLLGDKLANHILQRAQTIDMSKVDERVMAMEGAKSIANELTFLPVSQMDVVEEKIEQVCQVLTDRVLQDSRKHSRYPTLITFRYALRDYNNSFSSISRRYNFYELLSFRKKNSDNDGDDRTTDVHKVLRNISINLFKDKIGKESFELFRLSVQVSDFQPYLNNSRKQTDKTSIQSYLVKRDASSLFDSNSPEQPDKRQKTQEKKSSRTNLLSYFKRVP